jgi:hypothetical protein
LTPEVVTTAAPVMLPALVLLYVPNQDEVTLTEMVQEACAALIVAPLTVTMPLPATCRDDCGTARKVEPGVGARGHHHVARQRVVKLIPDCAGLPDPLVSVKVSVEVAPGPIEAGAKALVTPAAAGP